MTTNVQKRALEVMQVRECVTCGALTILTCLESTCENACCARCSDEHGLCEACAVVNKGRDDE